MKPELVFSVISKGSIIPPEAEKVIGSNRELCRKNNTGFVLFTPENNLRIPPAFFVDHYRNDIASIIPYSLYLDWDCLLKEIPDFENPDIARFGQNGNGTIDAFIFWSGNCEYVRDLQRRTKGKEWIYGIFYRELNRDKDILQIFPPELYQHNCLGRGRT